jgi:hypothetical protein
MPQPAHFGSARSANRFQAFLHASLFSKLNMVLAWTTAGLVAAVPL